MSRRRLRRVQLASVLNLVVVTIAHVFQWAAWWSVALAILATVVAFTAPWARQINTAGDEHDMWAP